MFLISFKKLTVSYLVKTFIAICATLSVSINLAS